MSIYTTDINNDTPLYSFALISNAGGKQNVRTYLENLADQQALNVGLQSGLNNSVTTKWVIIAVVIFAIAFLFFKTKKS